MLHLFCGGGLSGVQGILNDSIRYHKEVDPAGGNIASMMGDIKKHRAWDFMDQLKRDDSTQVLGLFGLQAIGLPDLQRKSG
jgi:hypothetical protein